MSKKTLQTILTTLFVIKFWGNKLKIFQLIFFISLKKISDFQTDFFFKINTFLHKKSYILSKIACIYLKKGSEKIWSVDPFFPKKLSQILSLSFCQQKEPVPIFFPQNMI